MGRSARSLFIALTIALVASLAVPLGASAQNRFNCKDFSSQRDAQAEFERSSGDPNRLDQDNDNIACDEFFRNRSNSASAGEYPRGGVASGGGSTAHDGLSPLPLILSGGALALLAAGAGSIALRRRLER